MYNSALFESRSLKDRKAHLENAHTELRGFLAKRNAFANCNLSKYEADLDAAIHLSSLYSSTGVSMFAERWSDLLEASPVNPLLLQPEDFLAALYDDGTRLLFASQSEQERERDREEELEMRPDLAAEMNKLADTDSEPLPMMEQVVKHGQNLNPRLMHFWPYPVSERSADPELRPINRSRVRQESDIVSADYLWVRTEVDEIGYLVATIKRRKLPIIAVFVEHENDFPHLLLRMRADSYEGQDAMAYERLEEDDESVFEGAFWECGQLVPLPWSHAGHQLLYFDPSMIKG